MKGAGEYAGLIKTGQYGKLHIVMGYHARGHTMHIFIYPGDAQLTKKNKVKVYNEVEVYGVVSGQPGWTETYGWLHKGKWVGDFNKIVKDLKDKRKLKEIKVSKIIAKEENVEQKRIKALLDSY